MDVRIDGVRYVPYSGGYPKKNANLGETLKALRETAGLSLDKASLQAGMSKTYLWELESGSAARPSFAAIVRLSRLYGVSLEVLAAAEPDVV